ncbi:MAG: hypothetical protein EOM59_22195 [Clostridia bacterium]|nr:hypothetical protein [Clostridia bacterium]NCC45329.1 hypothetical protein [Clostridia bacterium]
MDLKDIKTKRLSDIEKKIFFLAWLNEKLKAAGSCTLPILVGGSAVQLHTGGNYMSIDMDIYLDDIYPVIGLLEEQGFIKTGRHYFSAEYDILAEFVCGPIPEKISKIEYNGQTVLISSPEEMLIDRLTAAKWWKIPKDLEWARVIISLKSGLDMDYLHKRAAEEDIEDYLEMALQKNDEITKNNENIGSR